MTDLPEVKLRALANFPVSVMGGVATDVRKVNGAYFIDHDVSGLVQNTNISSDQVAQSWMTIWNSALNAYQNVPYALAVPGLGVQSLGLQTGALGIGTGLDFAGSTLEVTLANQAQAQAGTLNNVIMTPLRTAQQITADISSQADALAGTRNDVLMTPLRTAQVVSDSAPYVVAWDHGVTGIEGQDQTVALQALIDAARTAGGGNILTKGVIEFTTLDCSNTINLRLLGLGVNGGGGVLTRTLLRSGSTAARVIDCRGTVGFGMEAMYALQDNPLALGKFIAFGNLGGTESVFMTFDRCQIENGGFVGSRGLYLDGATRGRCTDCNLYGNSAVMGKDPSGTGGYSNVMLFERCNMFGHTDYPMLNPHGGWTLVGCNFEVSTDGICRAITTDAVSRFVGLAIVGGLYGDGTVGGGQWMQLYGDGLTISGIDMAGTGATIHTDGIILVDCNGFAITGNKFESLNTVIGPNGTCSGGLIAANHELSNTNFINTYAPFVGTIVSRMSGALSFHGLPTSAPAITGGLWIDTAAARVIKSAP